MASAGDKRGAAPANDSIDELLEGLPADPMLPRKRARSIEEVRAAAAPISENRRIDDKVLVSEGTDPRERARIDADRHRRESSTFGTAFLQARVTREKIIFGVVMMLAVLGIYAFVRHELHSNAQAQVPPAAAHSALAPPSSAPITAADIPPPPASAEAPIAPATTATSSHPATKSSHSSDAHVKPPPPPASASAGRTDVSRSL